MGKSYRHTPIHGVTTASSNKTFKKHEHRRERREVHIQLFTGNYDDLPHPKQYGNEWASPRDGKVYWGFDQKCTVCRHGGFWGGGHIACYCDELEGEYRRCFNK